MSKNIIILTSFIGFGHRRVAHAVQESLEELYGNKVDVSTINFFSLVSPEIERFLSDQYFHWIRENGIIWKYLYDPFSGKFNVSDLKNVKGRFFISFVNMILHFIFKKDAMEQLEQYLNEQYSGKKFISEKEFMAFLSGDLLYNSSVRGKREKLHFSGYFESFYRLVNFGYERLFQFFDDSDVDGVVATQVFPCYFTSYVKKHYHFPLFAILTDYQVHSYWLSPEVDRYFVPQKEQAEYLVDNGIEGGKIFDYGMPITGDFNCTVDRNALCKELGISPQQKIILIMGGGLGIGIEKLSEIFLLSLEKEYQKFTFIFICGNDREILERLRDIQQTFQTNIKVLGHREDIHRFMHSAELLITKPGGVTITEAMNCHLPMILIPVIKGQEEGNLEYFTEKKMAVAVGENEGVGSIVRELLLSKEYTMMRERLKLYAKKHASFDTAREIGRVIGLKG